MTNLLLHKIRKTQHETAKSLMQSGNTIDALISFKKNLKENGEHIFLLVDIAACYYTLQDHIQFKDWALKAYSKFLEFNSIFSKETYLRSSIAIGRFLEELGNFDQAIKIYDDCLNNDFDHQLKLLGKLYAQGLRVKSFIGDQENFYDFYNACKLKINTLDEQTNIQNVTEIYHSLMMADLYIGNISLAYSWLKKAISCNINKYERNWIVIDFLAEIFLQNRFDINTNQLIEQTSYIDCDAFEQSIVDLYQGKKATEEIICKMSNVGKFRYFEILQKLSIIENKNIYQNNSILNQSLFFFDATTIKKIIKRWSIIEIRKPYEILKYENYLILQINDKRMNVPINSLNGKLLSIFYENESKTYCIEKAINSIYNENLSHSGTEKIRQLVYRFNRDIKKHLLVEAFFKISSSDLQIRH